MSRHQVILPGRPGWARFESDALHLTTLNSVVELTGRAIRDGIRPLSATRLPLSIDADRVCSRGPYLATPGTRRACYVEWIRFERAAQWSECSRVRAAEAAAKTDIGDPELPKLLANAR